MKIKNLKWESEYQIKNGIPILLAKLDKFKKEEKELAESQAGKYEIQPKKWFPNAEVYEKILQPILELPKNSLVLELGGGVSYVSVLILRKDLRLVETDIALKTVLQTKRYLQHQNLGKNAIFLVCDAEKIPFAAKTFDAVFLISTFHHFPEPVIALQEIRRVVKPGGLVIFVAEPNRWPYCTIYPLTKLLRHWLRKRVPRKFDSPADEQTRGYLKKDLIHFFESAELEVKAIAPTLFLVQFYAHFLLFLNRLFRINLRRKEGAEKFLHQIDLLLAKIPFLNNFFWHWSIVARVRKVHQAENPSSF